MSPKVKIKKVDPPKGSEFQAWEKNFFNNNKEKLNCDKCNHTKIINHGIGGNLSQMGFRLIQTECASCGVRSRVEKLLKYSNQEALLQEYNQKMKEFNTLARPISFNQGARVSPQGGNLVSNQKDQNSSSISQILMKKRKVTTDRVINIEKDHQSTKLTETNPNIQDDSKSPEMKAILKVVTELKEQLAKKDEQIHRLIQQVERLSGKQAEQTSTPKIGGLFTFTVPQNNLNTDISKAGTRTNVGSLKENATKTNKQTSYADITKKNRPLKKKKSTNIKSVARKCWGEKEEPLEFMRFHIELSDSRPLRKCKSKRMKQKLVYAIIKSMGIRKHIILATPVGNSRLEIYAIDSLRGEMLDILDEKKIRYTLAPNLLEKPAYDNAKDVEKDFISRRLGWLYYHAKLQNLKKAILQGLNQEIQEKIKEFIPDYIQKNAITEDAPEVIEIADMDVCDSNLQTGAQHHE